MREIVLAGKDTYFLETWRSQLDSDASIQITNTIERLKVIMAHPACSLVLLDNTLLEPKGVKTIYELMSDFPHSRIVLIVDEVNEHDEMAAILFGARGYIEKNISLPLLQKMIEKVTQNEIWVSRKILTRLIEELSDLIRVHRDEFDTHVFDSALKKLTPRELEIAELVLTGAHNPRIAQVLCISERTVKAHLTEIFRKLNVTNRLQLALYMSQNVRSLNDRHSSKDVAN